MTPKFNAWQMALLDRDTLLLNLAIISFSWFSVWWLHIRKRKRLQYVARIGVYLVFYATLIFSYLIDRFGA